MKLNKLKIGTRLAVGYGIVLLSTLICSAIGISRLYDLHMQLNQITEVNDVQARMSNAMQATVTDRMIALRNIVLLEGRNDAKEFTRIEEQARLYAEAERSLLLALESDATVQERELMSRISMSEKRADPLMKKVVSLAQEGAYSSATDTLIKELRPVQRAWVNDINELVAMQHTQNVIAAEEGNSNYQQSRQLLIVLTCASLVFGVVVAYLTTTSIVHPLQTSVTLAQAVANGDLSQEIAASGADEMADLVTSLSQMNISLKKIVSEVRDGTGNVLRSSHEIAIGNQDLSSRTEQQASALEQTAAAMVELTETVKQNAGGAHDAEQLAHRCEESVRKGATIMSGAVDKMDAIADASRRVTEITGVIDSIAFQTNILALNAAVEAARAGEQGRGFAVVATEVRNLAQRAGAAAKEIKILIEETAQFVMEGTLMVKSAGSAMSQVSNDMASLSSTVQHIAAASLAQAEDIEQVNRAITEMDSVTQQNAALVEESAAAAESLSMEVTKLNGTVQHFRLETAFSLPQPHQRPLPLLANEGHRKSIHS